MQLFVLIFCSHNFWSLLLSYIANNMDLDQGGRVTRVVHSLQQPCHIWPFGRMNCLLGKFGWGWGLSTSHSVFLSLSLSLTWHDCTQVNKNESIPVVWFTENQKFIQCEQCTVYAHLLVLSADNFCKQFEPRSDRQNFGPDLDPNYFTLLWYSWKYFTKKLI